MILNRQSLSDKGAWEAAGVALPAYDSAAVAEKTKQEPIWLHFGAGNIFRGFIAALQQRLLEKGEAEQGIIVAETFDHEIIDKIYAPFDNQTLNVTLNADASVDCEVLASVTEALKAGADFAEDRQRLVEIFKMNALQMVSFTITEKGYALTDSKGDLLTAVKTDAENGPDKAGSVMAVTAGLLLERYRAGARPVAMVSMDNCSHNGDKLKSAVLGIAELWAEKGFADEGFINWLEDESKVSFPWTMIDKITPRPAKAVEELLTSKGIEGMAPIITGKGTYIAPYVNAEAPQYLVIEDKFPNGRPALEKAGVYMADRDTVNKVERMKVTTCLNPLHTAMSMYGCLLGYSIICEEMKDEDIVRLVQRLGYDEGLPVVTDPGILSPKNFLDEVVTKRLPNPFMPDDPRRIATDTSQKVGIRFGETVKSYISRGLDLNALIALPLAIAGWFRYLLAVDDEGKEMEVSADPLKEDLQSRLSAIVWNEPESYGGQLREILANPLIFGLNLAETELAERIEEMFKQLLSGPGAVRRTLKEYLQ